MPAALLTDSLPADVSGWLASEKFDGVRAIWDGEDFMSRNGRVIRVPQWFKDGMPSMRIDGELFAGRGRFEEVKGQCLRKSGQSFAGIRFMAFESCDMRQPIEERIAALRGLALPTHVSLVEHFELSGHDELDRMERAICAAGGEGMVIRRPGSLYRPGRAGDVVKVKRLVVDHARWQG